MLVHLRGMKWLEDAVKPGTHHNLWCAGQSAELIDDIRPVRQLVEDMIREFNEAYAQLGQMIRTVPERPSGNY